MLLRLLTCYIDIQKPYPIDSQLEQARKGSQPEIKSDRLPSRWPMTSFPRTLWCQRKWQTSDVKPLTSLWNVTALPSSLKFHSTRGPRAVVYVTRLSSSGLHSIVMGTLLIFEIFDMTFCNETFQIMTSLSDAELASKSLFWGFQLMLVIVFLCSDMIECSLNSLYFALSWKYG